MSANKKTGLRKLAAALLSAIVIGALARQELHAQGIAPASRPQLPAVYAFNGAPGCLNSASAACRRKPRSQPPEFKNSVVAAPMPEEGGSLLHVQGDAAAVRIDVRQTRMTDVLYALGAAFDISYHSSVMLDDEINGTFTGSLRRVIGRLLDGYQFVIKQQDSKLDVLIFAKRGERAVPAAPPPDPFRPLRERRRHSVK